MGNIIDEIAQRPKPLDLANWWGKQSPAQWADTLTAEETNYLEVFTSEEVPPILKIGRGVADGAHLGPEERKKALQVCDDAVDAPTSFQNASDHYRNQQLDASRDAGRLVSCEGLISSSELVNSFEDKGNRIQVSREPVQAHLVTNGCRMCPCVVGDDPPSILVIRKQCCGLGRLFCPNRQSSHRPDLRSSCRRRRNDAQREVVHGTRSGKHGARYSSDSGRTPDKGYRQTATPGCHKRHVCLRRLPGKSAAKDRSSECSTVCRGS
jgi:hypothetical protein